MNRTWIVPALVATIIAIASVIVVQKVRFDCVDVGFYKSCGVSTIK